MKSRRLGAKTLTDQTNLYCLVIFFCCLIISGCDSKDPTAKNSAPDENTGQQQASKNDVSIIKDWKGSNSAAQRPGNDIIRTNVQLKAAWALAFGNQEPQPDLPQVDFEKQMLIAVFMGQKNTGGHSIEMTGIEESAGDLTVHVAEQSPKPDDVTTQAITSPFHVVLIPRFSGEINYTKN